MSKEFKSGEIVAGAMASGSGVLTGWDGSGELMHGAIVAVCEQFGIKPPTARSAHAHLGKAVDALRAKGFVVRAARGTGKGAYKAIWSVGRGLPSGAVGDPFGTKVLEVRLSLDEVPSYDYTDDDGRALAEVVSTEFLRTSADELHPPGLVTQWLQETLVRTYRAIKMGGNWYLDAANAEVGAHLCQAMSECAGGWGANWMLPAIPIATTDELLQGLARGVYAEATALRDELVQRRVDAVRAGKLDIGIRTAKTFQARTDALGTRILSLEALIGAARLLPAGAILSDLRTDMASVITQGQLRGDQD